MGILEAAQLKSLISQCIHHRLWLVLLRREAHQTAGGRRLLQQRLHAFGLLQSLPEPAAERLDACFSLRRVARFIQQVQGAP